MRVPCKLVVAEDSDNDFVLLQIALSEISGLQIVHRSCHGSDLIEYLSARGPYADRARHPWPDLLLMDLNMPICDGFGVLRWIQQQPFPCRPRIVVLSSGSNFVDRELALSLGADEFHMKPDYHDHLVAIIKQVGEGAMCRP